jgi:phosphatidylglycerophosphatase A
MEKQPIKKFSAAALIATILCVGRIPFAPGTFGSLVAALEFLLYVNVLGSIFYFYGHLALMIPVAYIAVHFYLKQSENKDPKEVVIDEYIGQYIAQVFSFHALMLFGKDVSILIVVLISFMFFRFFDILKPGPVGYCDRNLKGANGVMMDDIVAGFFAAICTFILCFIIF